MNGIRAKIVSLVVTVSPGDLKLIPEKQTKKNTISLARGNKSRHPNNPLTVDVFHDAFPQGHVVPALSGRSIDRTV